MPSVLCAVKHDACDPRLPHRAQVRERIREPGIAQQRRRPPAARGDSEHGETGGRLID